MAIELMGDEGEVSVVDYSGAGEITAEEAAVEEAATEEVVQEETVEEEIVEESAATDTVDEGGAVETYSEQDVVELMKIHEQKILEEIQRQNAEREAPAVEAEVKKAPAPSELVAATLEEVLATVGEEEFISGKDLKDILTKTFLAMNTKAEQFNVEAEHSKFNAAAGLYQQKYVPGLIQQYGLDPNSRDARFIRNSFLETLSSKMQTMGRSEAAAKAAATEHILSMTKEFGGEKKAVIQPVKKTVMIDRKLASGNTGSEPSAAKTSGIDPALAKRIESNKASTSELLRTINARK